MFTTLCRTNFKLLKQILSIKDLILTTTYFNSSPVNIACLLSTSFLLYLTAWWLKVTVTKIDTITIFLSNVFRLSISFLWVRLHVVPFFAHVSELKSIRCFTGSPPLHDSPASHAAKPGNTDMVLHAYNPSTWESEAGEFWVQNQQVHSLTLP